MSSGHVALAILLSGLAVCLTDWLFFGVLFHDKYLAYPEIWRQAPAGEGKAVFWSILLGFVTCAAFVVACSAFHVRAYAAATGLAAAIWAMVPLPLLITNALFIKLHPLTVLAHALGWLVKLLVAAAAVGWLAS
jgi:hypothetical protein